MRFVLIFTVGLSMASVLYYAAALFATVMAPNPISSEGCVVKLQNISYYMPLETFVQIFLYLDQL